MTEYIRVQPTRESINADTLARNVASLHKMGNQDSSSGGIKSYLNPLDVGSKHPTFEFLVATGGKNTKIEFLYRVDDGDLNVLKKRLVTAYPSSFDIERVDIDIRKKLISPEEYEPEDYVREFEDGHLLHDPNKTGTKEDLTDKHLIEQESSLSSDDIFINQEVDDDEVEGRPVLKESSDLEGIQPLTTKDATAPAESITGPSWTDDNTVLARPQLEQGTPIAVRWNGVGDRKKDWMTTMSNFTKRMQTDSPDLTSEASLSNLIQHLSDVEHPVVFQVLFKSMHDWTATAKQRKRDLHLNKDSMMGKVAHNLNQFMVEGDKKREVMRDKKRDYFDKEGESSRHEDSEVLGSVGKRAEMIDNKHPHKTFITSARAVSVATEDQEIGTVRKNMRDLATVLDDLDGYFYHVNGELVQDTGGFLNGSEASIIRQRLVEGRLPKWDEDKKSPTLVLNGDELSNFVAVPSAEGLTAEGSRGTRAEARSRTPLPRPHPDLMQQFHTPGLRTGFALDEENDEEPVPTRIPPGLLTKHYARFATTGAGKSKALINDILSLYENTSGPTILIDPKGDGMTENYMRTHYERFGQQDWKENVIHFNVPDILPGFGFFDIEPALENGARRIDAVQRKADHYEELLKLVMGTDRYRQSKVAPTVIKALIKALFDKKYGKQREGRESSDKFGHRDLEKAVKGMRKKGLTDDEDEGWIPNVRDERIKEVLTRHMDSDAQDFSSIMDAVYNRIDYIREDAYLSRIFNNTDRKFDFRDHLDDDTVILFDLGELRDEPTRIITGLILTNLWDALQDADQEKCTAGHESIQECRQNAPAEGRLPCREPWGDDHVVNLIIDEAASVAVTDLMSKMLEQGRSFNLGMGLSMQFPEQMKDTNERMYRNILNNIGSLLIGKITLDREIADAIAHENIDAEDFGNRIKALPRGEWIIQLPSPEFQETGPEPFSLAPLPIPSGHPESETPLDESAEETFQHYLDNVIHERIQDDYGIALTDMMQEYGGDDGTTTEIESTDEQAENGSSGSADGSPEDEQTDQRTPVQTTDGETPSPGNNVGTDSKPVENTAENGGGIGRLTASVSRGDTDNPPNTGDDEENKTRAQASPDDTQEEGSDEHAETATSTEDQGEANQQELASQEPANQWNADSQLESFSTTEDQDTFVEHTDARGDGGTQAVSSDTNHTDTEEVEEEVEEEGASLETPSAGTESDPPESNSGSEPNDPTSIDRSVRIDNIPKINRAIDKWNRDTVLSAASAFMSAFQEAEGELGTLKKILSRLAEDARLAGVTHDDGTVIDTADLMAAGETADPAPLDIDVPALMGRAQISTSDDQQTSSRPSKTNSENGDDTLSDDSEANGQSRGDTPETPSEGANIDWQHCGLSDEEIRKSDYTEGELNFMHAVVEAMNGDLEGYDLTQSMGVIKSGYGVNVEKLERKGVLKIHPMSNDLRYYTVTTAGQKACNNTKHEGPGIGDRGGNTPHRVGCELAVRYLKKQPDVDEIKSFVSVSDSSAKKVDVIGRDKEGTITYVVEVESGQTQNETGSENNTVGINDYAGIEKDYDELSSADDATALWVLRNGNMAARVLKILNNAGKTEIINPDRIKKEARARFNPDRVEPHGGDGMDRVLTFKDLREDIGK